jgi:parvulin-like peptidyl-prolyl isomerase
VYVQQIIVTLNGRTRDMAVARAQEAYREAADGKTEFLQLAAKYSDDPDKVRNGGDLGYYDPHHFPEPVAEAIAKLDKKGEIAGPIEAPDGYHIVRFVNRQPAQQASFDDVKKKLIDNERARLKKEKVDAFIAQLRSSKTVVIHQQNVESYVVPVDMNAAHATGTAGESPAPAKTETAKKVTPKKDAPKS